MPERSLTRRLTRRNIVNAFDTFARYYDVDTAGYDDDIPFFVASARRAGGPVLEVACGTGRVLIPIAEAGLDVVGVDISPAMIHRARAKVEVAGVSKRVRLLVADARELALRQRFSFAFIALNSFTHFATPDDQGTVLQRLHEHLATDATLVLDLPNPETTLLADAGGQLTHEYTQPLEDSDVLLMKLRSHRTYIATQTVSMTLVFDEIQPDGAVRRAVASFPLRYLYRPEAELLLERHGFLVENVYGDHDLNPYTSSSEKLVIVARRV